MWLAPDNALNARALHQPCDRAAGDIEVFATQLPPDLANTINAPVLFEDTPEALRPGARVDQIARSHSS